MKGMVPCCGQDGYRAQVLQHLRETLINKVGQMPYPGHDKDIALDQNNNGQISDVRTQILCQKDLDLVDSTTLSDFTYFRM